jgi:hypothetical protein
MRLFFCLTHIQMLIGTSRLPVGVGLALVVVVNASL